ncbi:MAG: saccharopine dehydrogenase NADP-binding domain-containing protein [Alphaproteobacteria bacterium]|nr:saccharopine dehydrogenase NADP-binding domain-containing protein [Alphaproteobacteria bacterium]
MTARVLIIGGYGNFGSFIARRLAQETDIKVIIVGRSGEKAKTLAESLKAEWTVLDIENNFEESLRNIKPDIVIHTSGPFQERGYNVAEACIRNKCHYIDLADGREFVTNITKLDGAAKKAGAFVISGASSVPALTSAIIDKYKSEFKTLDTAHYGITTAQKTNRGLATTKAVLSYAGKPFKTMIDGRMQTVYGWQSLHWRKFQGLGWRTLGNCDVPDLELFPQRYPELKTIRFYAGLELPVIHLPLWLMTWLVRIGLVSNLKNAAPFLLKLSRPFDLFGTDTSGFYMEMSGMDAAGKSKQLNFDLIARSGDGPYIPCMPAILTALMITRGQIHERGAFSCVGFLTLDALLDLLKPLDIEWTVSVS